MKKYILITLFALISSLYSCSQENKIYNAQIEYPYVASEKRQDTILQNMNKLEKGITNNEVLKLLSLPDEINPTYPPNKTGKKEIGYSYVYIIERKQETGSQIEKSEKLIRIHYNLDGVLLSAYAIEIPEFNEIYL
ncbi:MAG: hypothetical protein K8R68_02090 [Bacteroidales bacterium]|nr:hypothetical protein [Bacteroidales bacterium]